MKIVIITLPEFLPGEAQMIRTLLEEGADRVHVRKPGSSEEDFRRLLEEIPQDCRAAVTLQDHVRLTSEYGFGGVHLNSRNPSVPEGFMGLVSRSCHSFEEVAEHKDEDYLFLSPVYESISKQGYKAAITPEMLAESKHLLGPRIIALGGVQPANLQELKAWGFGGAAFLGYIWKDAVADHALLKRRLAEIKKNL